MPSEQKEFYKVGGGPFRAQCYTIWNTFLLLKMFNVLPGLTWRLALYPLVVGLVSELFCSCVQPHEPKPEVPRHAK